MSKVVQITDFTNQWDEGRVHFLILNATFDEIDTVRGVSEVLKLDVELTTLDEETDRMTLRNHLIFTDYTQRSLFHQFFIAAKQVLDPRPFTEDNLIGLSGTVELKYYQPEGSNYAYERLFDWQFELGPDETNQALRHHFDAEAPDTPIGFEVTDEDINF